MTAALLAVGVLLSTVEPPAATVEGWSSAYAPGVMEEVISVRNDLGLWWNPLPPDWYTVAGYAAVVDCSMIGKVVEMRPAGAAAWQRVLVADCGNPDEPGVRWMTDNNILAELDARLYARWSDQYGTPLLLEMRGGG